MQKIDFLVPGFSKCGTTTLCALLAQHPDVFITEPKEPNFLTSVEYELNHWSVYEALFSDSSINQILGEGSTSYTTVEFEVVARERILHHYPDIKLIFIARDPLRRIESSYREFHHSGPSFGLDAPFKLSETLKEIPKILHDSCYWQRISNYRDHMPEENIHVVFLEDLKEDPAKTIGLCFDFLGVKKQFGVSTDSLRLNSGGKKLYDSTLLRSLRNNPYTGFKIARIPITTQDKIFRPLGLRRPFKHDITWDEETVAAVTKTLNKDSKQFLQHYGKDLAFWSSVG